MSTRITGDDWGAVIHGAPELVSDGLDLIATRFVEEFRGFDR